MMLKSGLLQLTCPCWEWSKNIGKACLTKSRGVKELVEEIRKGAQGTLVVIDGRVKVGAVGKDRNYFRGGGNWLSNSSVVLAYVFAG